jgi:8-oxo-dGTP pyrophosphatase MutT (NUDIX family)
MGHMHNGETILDTVKRELMEETNITSDKIRRLFSFDINDRCDTGVLSHHIYAFEVFVDDKALIVLNSEASEAKWLTCKDIQKLPKISNKARMVISKLEK